MKKATKLFAVISTLAILATCLACFCGCNGTKETLSVKIDGSAQSIKLEQVQDNSWFVDLALSDNSTVTVKDDNGTEHSVKVNDGGKYTVLLTKNGNNYNVEARKEKKAVIWVTALLSGGLYDSETNEPVWDPLPYDDITLKNFLDLDNVMTTVVDLAMRMIFSTDSFNFNTLAGPILKNIEDESNLFWNMGFDNDGKPNNPNLKPANDFEGKIRYGVMGAYTDHDRELNEKYNAEGIEFKVFNYDWRFDCADGATELEKYIDQNKFTDVVLFSHSMGGNVVATYLARNTYNRARTVKYVSMGGAFWGSFDALYTMENIQNYFGSVLDNMGMNLDSLLETLPALLVNMINGMNLDAIFDQLQRFIINMDTFVQLLPTFDLVQSKQYGEDGDGVAFTIDGVAITTADELYAFYESRPWAWKKDENNEYIMDGDKHVIRDIVKDLRNFHESQYVTLNNGSKIYSTMLVDTVYVTGSGIVSFCGADLDTSTNEVTFRTTTNADLQVLFYSSIVNQDEKVLRENGKLFEYPGSNHLEVGCNWELIKELTYQQIDEAFKLNH